MTSNKMEFNIRIIVNFHSGGNPHPAAGYKPTTNGCGPRGMGEVCMIYIFKQHFHYQIKIVQIINCMHHHRMMLSFTNGNAMILLI